METFDQLPKTVSTKRLLDISWSTNAFAFKSFRQHIPSVRIRRDQGITTDAACEADRHMPFKAIIFLILRRAMAESCFALEITTTGCSSILANRHWKTVTQMDRAVYRSGLPSNVILYTPCSNLINWRFAWQS